MTFRYSTVSPIFALCTAIIACSVSPVLYAAQAPNANYQSTQNEPHINAIIITGNTYIPDQAIRVKIPYYPGSPFKKEKTGQLIRSVYSLGYFRNVQVRTQQIGRAHV